uniref:Glutathione S-transferase 1 n=1 Tax=Cajanus cajan TaxID=3821 RepID=A0A151TBP7_CAJCA|nr:Glutathione S-transferase 1 [Cajanus cajan]
MNSRIALQKSGGGSNASNPVLYSFSQSSCSWRIRFALCLKGIPYECKEVDLSKGEQYSPEFEKLNPLHYVPVLVDDNVVVSDSYAIFLVGLVFYYSNCNFISFTFPFVVVASIVHSSIQPLHMLNVLKDMEKMFGAESKPWAQFTIDKGFSALEKLLKDFAGTYATGEHIYMADVFLAPQITQAVQRFDIDMVCSQEDQVSRFQFAKDIISFLKCSLTCLNVDDQSLNSFSSLVCCQILCWPLIYLNPLGRGYFSVRGHITLIQSSLSSIPLYYLSFSHSSGCCSTYRENLKITRHLLWSGTNGLSKDHLVN